MAMNRRTALAGLEIVLKEIVEVKTVKRTLIELDIKQYLASQLPLIAIKEPGEIPVQELTGRRALVSLETTLKIWFVHWGESPDTTEEALVKVIRNKVGKNFTVENTTVATWVKNVSEIGGTMPVFWFTLDLIMHYYLNQQDT